MSKTNKDTFDPAARSAQLLQLPGESARKLMQLQMDMAQNLFAHAQTMVDEALEARDRLLELSVDAGGAGDSTIGHDALQTMMASARAAVDAMQQASERMQTDLRGAAPAAKAGAARRKGA